MSFRGKILLTIFVAALLPSMIILGLSVWLLNSTLSKIGAAGLEDSLNNAKILADDSQIAIGNILKTVLSNQMLPSTDPEMEQWLRNNRVDLAFFKSDIDSTCIVSDSLLSDLEIITKRLPQSGGISHFEINDRFMIIYTIAEGNSTRGCGILMPAGFAQRGRILSGSISASASLPLYKKFSIKLLGIISIIAVILSLAIGFVFSAIISNQLVKPLRILSAGARKIGSGDFDHKVQIKGSSELTDLADSFNLMSSEIKRNQELLLRAERLAAWREVARRIAHEVKNPLTPIAIELHRLKSKLGSPESDAIKSLEAIEIQAKSLNDLAQQFSTFAKEPELHLCLSSIEDIIMKSVAIFESASNLNITTDISNDIPSMNLDPQMMNRVFNNLIKNAIEAMPSCANLSISACISGKEVLVTFRDDGPGFPEEKLKSIDQPYLTSKKTGTGLGLVIVKKIIEEHKGRINFFNQNGAVIEIVLPL